MGAIDNFLKRWGFLKLDRYGLVITPDDRVISMRAAVLDDGLGGKIVGWLEGDLAAMELEHWGPKKGKPKKIVAPAGLHKLLPAVPLAARVVAPAAPAELAPAPIAPSPAAAVNPAASASGAALAPRIPAPARALPGVAPAPAAVTSPTPFPAARPAPAPVVAAAQEPGEDEWEWEIAMARARACADEVEEARVDLLGASVVIASPVITRKTTPGMSAVAPRQATREPEPLPPWPQTQPFNEAQHLDKTEPAPYVMSALQKKIAADKRTPPRALPTVTQQRSTVIPVPQLPTTSDPRSVRAPYTPAQPRGRMARGTGAPGKIEDTVRTMAAPPSARRAANDDKTSPSLRAIPHDDRTSPYIEIPSEVKPSGFAHTKRVAAKQR